jgi:small subunit ribosomal protein S6
VTRTYEFAFIADPRLSDEEVVALTEEYKAMIVSDSTRITKEESWGKRKLAYPINKLNEGKYVIFYLEADGKNPLPEVEHRMRQNDKILRYLTVRTDQDLKRAARKGKKPRKPLAAAEGHPQEAAKEN